MTIENYFEQAQLSFASYATLVNEIPDIPALTDVGMSPIQAADFAANWRVVDQYTDTTNGLSATVFESVATGERYLAVRGTEGLLDLWTDFIDIAVLGTPERQAQYASLRDQVAAWLSDGTLTSGFTVTGHSLGGFLSGALLVDYPMEIGHAYLYNAPGVGGLSAGLRLLAGLETEPSLDLTKVSNLISEAGFSLTAGLGLDWGAPIAVLIEDQSPNYLDNHSIVHLTDALAVQSLLGELSASSDIAELGDILRAASNQNDFTLESVVNAVGIDSVTLTGPVWEYETRMAT